MTKIVGTGGDDTLRGTDETDRIWGLVGNDDIDGGAEMTSSMRVRETTSSGAQAAMTASTVATATTG
jgi:Ca2+-binding RTX toxin-like protein